MEGSKQTITEGGLTFTFPDETEATKYDNWSFYINQFQKNCKGTKAVDLMNLQDGVLWLIEVKDYRQHPRTKPSDLGEEVAQKVRDSLAGLVAARCNANDAAEQSFAKKALKSHRLRVVLHLELPRHPSRLFPKPIDPSNVQTKLRQLLGAIDPHPLVVDKGRLDSLTWRVTSP